MSSDKSFSQYEAKMKPPIIFVDSIDIMIFASIVDAEEGVEAADVEGLMAYDCQGALLDLIVNKGNKMVSISERIPSENCSEVLRSKLINFLVSCGISENNLKDLTLMELINQAWEFMPWSNIGK